MLPFFILHRTILIEELFRQMYALNKTIQELLTKDMGQYSKGLYEFKGCSSSTETHATTG